MFGCVLLDSGSLGFLHVDLLGKTWFLRDFVKTKCSSMTGRVQNEESSNKASKS